METLQFVHQQRWFTAIILEIYSARSRRQVILIDFGAVKQILPVAHPPGKNLLLPLVLRIRTLNKPDKLSSDIYAVGIVVSSYRVALNNYKRCRYGIWHDQVQVSLSSRSYRQNGAWLSAALPFSVWSVASSQRVVSTPSGTVVCQLHHKHSCGESE